MNADEEMKKDGHFCKMDVVDDIHDIEREYYGYAISKVQEGVDGRLWADNGEYCSQVNYWPKCGYKAATPVLSR